MRPPRMRVALFGRSLAGISLANAMERAGHTVEMLNDPAELGSFQALILAVGEARLDAAVELVQDHVHKGLIAFHTCLSRGVQGLDPLETHGCIVAAIAPIAGGRWAVSTLDELGENIADFVVTEFRGQAVPLSDAERPAFAARSYYIEMLSRLHLAAAVEANFFAEFDEIPPSEFDIDTEDIIAAYRGATDPGMRRHYLETARRLGEVEDRTELEMWALQEESR
ncbi:hypothetical protein QPX50_07050 [Corynebacterium accolens]|uniref:hypothetical protein n=1 Tax=Corynebacterium accolens TaxID=38284 RepID=UPI002543699E|nr:hypothetical protein [Corynebacterium accolens]MDK4330663.1 hypothetical protein [Corynebacterium accolens]MDK8592887.1 hypothetical protein [Corynebacterium accolens]WKS67754.1 hypothetical protein NLL33_04915 [Corynebacterium accolens]